MEMHFKHEEDYKFSLAEVKKFLIVDGEDRPSRAACTLLQSATQKAYMAITPGHSNREIVSAVYDSLTTMLDTCFPIPAPEGTDDDYLTPSWSEYIPYMLTLWGKVFENYETIDRACDLQFANIAILQEQTS